MINQIKIYNKNTLNFNQPIFDKWSYRNRGTPTRIIIKNIIDVIILTLNIMFKYDKYEKNLYLYVHNK